jgi:Spy/CpxP family protein refolding chaperone
MNTRSIIVGLVCAMSAPLLLPLDAAARPHPGMDCAGVEVPADGGAAPPGARGHRMHKPPFLRGVQLTDEQRAQIRQIWQAQRDQMCQRIQTVREARKALHDLARAPQFDPVRAKEIADGSAGAMAELAVMRAETEHRILALLTPDQRRIVDERAARRRPVPPPPPER